MIVHASAASSRRAFIACAASLLGPPFNALAQGRSGPGSAKIGYLHPLTTDWGNTSLKGLRSTWLRLGYADEMVVRRAAGGDLARLPALAGELIEARVSVLIVVGPAALRAASQATRTVPIVAVDLETDPVRAGYVRSLARPGGNVTGVFLDQALVAGKWVDLLREAAPAIRRVAIVWDPQSGVDQKDTALEATRVRGLDSVLLERGSTVDYDEVLGRLAATSRTTGVLHLAMAGFGTEAHRLFPAAQKHGMASITFLRIFSVGGGAMMSYGPIEERYLARAMMMADKILKGAGASELPIERPDHYELVINQKVADAIGLKMSRLLLMRADEVIQ